MPIARPQGAGRAVSALSVDDAIAEITERQRTLYGETEMAAPLAPREPVPFMTPQPEAAAAPMSFGSRQPQPLPPSAAVEPPAAKAAASVPAAPALDISKLEEQLRNITTRIETLRPSSDLEEQLRSITARIETLRPNNNFEEVITSFRKELAEIGRQITEALPRHAVESLQIEVQALAQRIDHSRTAGSVDASALAGLERGLAEVRDALRNLTPAENLVGFNDAVRSLAQKIDLIIGKEDPATLQQLETAISALRGIVSHVASNDTLTKVAEDVRALAAKVDEFANTAATGQAVSALESRLDTLADALSASTEAGHAVPRELEKLLSGLIEKLEWVQLTQTDHAALGHLEDRIAQLIKRLDASDARLGNLEAVERGLADLLVHIDEARSRSGTVTLASPPQPVAQPATVDAIKREVAEIKRGDRRTQDSLEAVHGAVEHVVDRLAMIESGMHEASAPLVAASSPVQTETADTTKTDSAKTNSAKAESAKTEPAKSEAAKPEPTKAEMFVAKTAPAPATTTSATPASPVPAAIAPVPMSISAADVLLGSAESPFDAAPRRMVGAAPRTPLDPNLPPDHPLEPGSAPGSRGVSSGTISSGTLPSAADRIAASEAAASLVEPPAAAEPNGKPNFIAAARKAAQAAAAAQPDRKARAKRERSQASGSSPRMRKLLVAGGAVVVAVLFAHVVLHMFQDNGGSAISPPPLPEQSTDVPLEKDSATTQPAATPAPLVLPVPGGPADMLPNAAPSQPLNVTPNAQPDPSPAVAPQRQSALPDVTGSLPGRAPAGTVPAPGANPFQPIPAPAAIDADKLPASIGGPALRAAAAAGDMAAEYEVASRFAEGRGVAVSNEQAAHWLQRAADQGLPPAQFRLGGLYEKGIGVKKDLAQARDLYTAAADKGNGKAMHNLAVLYAEGINGPADYTTAAQWFRKAADRGITDSQYNLAILYARGIGVEQNYAESYKWFTLAANRGDADAGKKRDEIAAHLDPQSLQAAQTAAQKWTAAAQPDEAINVKAPAGGWDPQTAKPATKPKAAGPKPEAKL
jgi:localization factor PodJL